LIDADRKNCATGGVLDVNVTDIDWRRGVFNWIYGIRRYFLKHDLVAPEKKMVPLLTKNQLSYFHDLRFAKSATDHLHYQNNTAYFQTILQAGSFNNFCNDAKSSLPEGVKLRSDFNHM
jgi:hypothetical protein